MRTGYRVLIRIILTVVIVYCAILLYNQLESIKVSLDSLYELLASSRLLKY